MAPETRAHSLTRSEMLLAPTVPVEERQQSLVEMRHLHSPDKDTMAAVIPLLNDADESLRHMATHLLSQWGQQAITMLLQALRGTTPQDVPYRLAIIEQLQRMGPEAARAETLLRSLFKDPDVGPAAEKAVRAIRLDGADLTERLLQWAIELCLLSFFVAAPVIAMRQFAPVKDLPPLGFSIGFASLVVAGLMLARIAYASDMMPYSPEEDEHQPGRWTVYLVMIIGGGAIGGLLAIANWACGGVVQGWFR
ncbi:MAG: HEAT repeat domain-containing protein [Gemmatales bacterium]